MCSGPSLAPRFAGFTVPARPTRDNRNGRMLYPVRAVRFSWSAWTALRQRCEPFMLPQVVAWRRDRRSQSPSGSGCLGTGVQALGHETVCFVSLGLGALVLSLRIFCVKNLLSSWWTGVGVALALILARLLRGRCPLVPRNLLPVLWVAVRDLGCPSPARLDISLLPTWCLVLGPCFLVRRLPSVSLPWIGPVGGVRVCLHFLKWCLYYFLEILDLIFFGISGSFCGNVWFLLFLELLASSCPGSYGREDGSAGLCLHPPASMALDPQRLSGSPH